MADDKLITTTEAGRILGVTRYHISYLVRTGVLKAIRHTDPYYGGKAILLILRDSVIEYQENRRKPGRPDSNT